MTHGVILSGRGGLYNVKCEDGSLQTLRAMKKLHKQAGTLLVGDRVAYLPGKNDEHGWITEVLPRENTCLRPPVANISLLAIVIAPEPAPDFLLIDKLLIGAREQEINAVIVCNKADLDNSLYASVCAEYAHSGAKVLGVSAVLGQGLAALRAAMAGRITCFAGQSGVGKSTLLNALFGFDLRTGAISSRIQRGKHTTRHVELFTEGDLSVLDTPGFSLLEMSDVSDPVLLREYYPEFAPYGLTCRFSPCFHQSEPGCQVLSAAKRGEISQQRLERYHILLAKARQAWKERYD